MQRRGEGVRARVGTSSLLKRKLAWVQRVPRFSRSASAPYASDVGETCLWPPWAQWGSVGTPPGIPRPRATGSPPPHRSGLTRLRCNNRPHFACHEIVAPSQTMRLGCQLPDNLRIERL